MYMYRDTENVKKLLLGSGIMDSFYIFLHNFVYFEFFTVTMNYFFKFMFIKIIYAPRLKIKLKSLYKPRNTAFLPIPKASTFNFLNFFW